MEELQSHNTALSNSPKAYLVPTWGQMVIYFICSIFLLMLLNIRALWTYFNGSVGVSSDTALSVIREPFDKFSNFTSGLFQGRLAPMIFWAFMGIVTYMVIWFIQNAATNVQNDLAAEQYKHPWTFRKERYWWHVAGDKLYLVCSFIVFGIYLYLCGAVLFPMMGRLFYAAIYNWHLSDSLPRLIAATFCTTFLLYLLILLAHLVRNSWRWVTSNL